jgi:hypothetical protein
LFQGIVILKMFLAEHHDMCRPSRILPIQACLAGALAVCCLAGCGGSGDSSAAEDPAPFLQAVEKYLDQGNMAMSVKEVKAGPMVNGDTATLTASLTRSDVGGPSTTWTFTFQKDSRGTWNATGYEK